MTDQYLKIPVLLFKLKISAIERYIVALMIGYGGETYASNETMADMFGCSRQSIIDAVNKLEGRKFVTRKRTRNGRIITLTSQETLLLRASEVVKKLGPSSQETLPEVVKKLGASSQETLPNSKVYKSIIVNDSKGDRTQKKQSSTNFHKPTAKEVSDYAQSIQFKLDGQYFIDTYEAKGWLIGKNKMKDWRASVRTWKKNEDTKHGSNKNQRMRHTEDFGLMRSAYGTTIEP